jgi:hypothetical protein
LQSFSTNRGENHSAFAVHPHGRERIGTVRLSGDDAVLYCSIDGRVDGGLSAAPTTEGELLRMRRIKQTNSYISVSMDPTVFREYKSNERSGHLQTSD